MIISVFSPTWFFAVALGLAVLILLSLLMQKKPREQKLHFMKVLSGAGLVFLLAYKVWIFFDPGYDAVFFDELPLNLCNIALVISYFAAKKDQRLLQAFLFYVSTLGAAMALLTPSEGFYDVPLYLARCIGYWGFHLLVLVISIGYVTLGIYQPRLRDIPYACLMLATLGALAHGCNTLLRATVSPTANYFFTYGINGNFITDALLRLIPRPFIFMLPLLLPLALVDCLMCLLAKTKRHKAADAEITV